MEEQKKTKALKIAIIILIILLLINIICLSAILLYNHFAADAEKHATVKVPENIINQDMIKDTESDSGDDTLSPDTGEDTEPPETYPPYIRDEDKTPTGGEGDGETTAVPDGEGEGDEDDGEGVTAVVLELHNSSFTDNTPFYVPNMFPGDVETKYFCVRATYHDSVTVRYRANVRAGYEKLAEVLMCRVKLLNTGDMMYDGLMRDMPTSLDALLECPGKTTEDLYYEITAYLDTSVGNDYQNKRLVADFMWWVEGEEDTGNLDPDPGPGPGGDDPDDPFGPGGDGPDSPQTGDNIVNLLMYSIIALSSLTLALLLILYRRRREENEDE